MLEFEVKSYVFFFNYKLRINKKYEFLEVLFYMLSINLIYKEVILKKLNKDILCTLLFAKY
jgi:hypothetical protein